MKLDDLQQIVIDSGIGPDQLCDILQVTSEELISALPLSLLNKEQEVLSAIGYRTDEDAEDFDSVQQYELDLGDEEKK